MHLIKPYRCQYTTVWCIQRKPTSYIVSNLSKRKNKMRVKLKSTYFNMFFKEEITTKKIIETHQRSLFGCWEYMLRKEKKEVALWCYINWKIWENKTNPSLQLKRTKQRLRNWEGFSYEIETNQTHTQYTPIVGLSSTMRHPSSSPSSPTKHTQPNLYHETL
jgi:hypothetical protein